MKKTIIYFATTLLLSGCVPTPKPVTWVGQPKNEWVGQTDVRWVTHPKLEWAEQLKWIGAGDLHRSEVKCHPYRRAKLSECQGCIHVIRNPRNESNECGISLMCCESGGRCWTSTFIFLGPGEETASFVCGPRYEEVWMKCFFGDEDPSCALSFLDF